MRRQTRARPKSGEVYIEFRPVGNSVRVVAIDATTGTEVTIVGPVSAARSHLERLVLAKLDRRLARDRA